MGHPLKGYCTVLMLQLPMPYIIFILPNKYRYIVIDMEHHMAILTLVNLNLSTSLLHNFQLLLKVLLHHMVIRGEVKIQVLCAFES